MAVRRRKPAAGGEVRRDYISVATENVESLIRVLGRLNLAEVDFLLELESAGMRRKSALNRLIKRRCRLVELDERKQLMAKYMGHEQKTIKDPGNPKASKKAKTR